MSRPLRVALFSGNYNYVRDGANQALNRLVAHLEGVEGISVRVYSPTTDTPAFAPAGTLVSVPSIGFPGRGEYRVALGLPRRIREDVRDFSPDIVHLSAPDLLGTQAQAFAREQGIPIVTSLHTRFETYFDYYGLGWLKPMIERRLARFYGKSDYVLVPNQAILHEMTEKDGDDGRIRIWGRGVDHDFFSPARRSAALRLELGYDDEEVVVLFFGRLVLEKGVDTFIKVIAQLRERGHKLRPMIVGDGPARSHFAQMPNTVFMGQLSGDRLAGAVAAADILLNPSRTEAFGNVVLEAMAASLAVVSADAPSARALIRHEQTGLLCPPDNIRSYVDAVERLILFPRLRRTIGAAARQASTDHRWATALSSVAEVYREALRLSPAERPRARLQAARTHNVLQMETGQSC